MKGILLDYGFEIVDMLESAEVIVINTCCVKKPTENKIFNYLNRLKELKLPIVVAGCLAQAMPGKVKNYALLGPDNITEIKDIIEELMHKNVMQILDRKQKNLFELPKVRKNKIVEIIPISTGCLGNCSYCIVKSARGDFYSYDSQQIVKRVKDSVLTGAKEIWLTSQDTGCYGHDIKSSLPELLNRLVLIEGDFKIRIGMMNPEHLLGMIDEISDILSNPKVFKFLHIPVQSGNNRILKKMKRKYAIEDFVSGINEVRKTHPDLTLSTDVICGFPTETEKEFKETVRLIELIKPDFLNISRFWPRPGTPAARYKQLNGEITKNRSRLITSVFEWDVLEKNKKWVNWEGKVLIDEKGKDNSWVGRNYAYKPVLLFGDYELGQTLDIKVVKHTTYDLRAVPL